MQVDEFGIGEKRNIDAVRKMMNYDVLNILHMRNWTFVTLIFFESRQCKIY